MRYRRMPIEIESPEQLGYSTIRNNLAESSFSDMCLADYGVEADVGRLLLQYGDHLGAERLRRLIAGDGDSLSPDHVLVTAGAASALFIIATSLLGPDAHALICAPNYATNLETPRAVGADVETIDLRFEDGEWAVARDSPQELWEFMSTTAPPLKNWLGSLDAKRRAEVDSAYLELLSSGVLRREYLLALGSRR